MPTPCNVLNITTAGLVVFDGTSAFTADTTTNHAILVGAASNGITSVGPSATSGQVLQSAGLAADPAFSTATYPATATGTGTLLRADGTNWVATTSTYPNTNAVSTLLYASSANVMSALATANDGILITSHTGVPSILAGPGATGKVLQSNSILPPSYSTATYPSVGTSTGSLLRADGTNWVATTSTYPDTNAVSTLLYASSANVMAALTTANDGVLVTSHTGVPSILAGPGAAGKVLQSNAAAAPSYSTPTYPSTSGTSRKILVSDGTNNVYSTETWAVPGTSGNVLTSDGTNWTSAAAASGGVSVVTIYNLADSPATWTKNSGTKWIQMYIIAGGAGGGSGRKGATTASSGGAGGTYGQLVYTQGPAASFASGTTVTVGRGGVGGLAVSTNNTNGNVGDGVTAATNSSFGTLVALAGTGGGGGQTTNVTGPTGPDRLNLATFGIGSAGSVAGTGSTTAGGSGIDTVNMVPTNGGGGGGGDTGTARAGGKGADVAGGVYPGAAGGTADGGGGGNGTTTTTNLYMPGQGGGGGGGCKTVNAGNGGNGSTPGGGGGGGGGGINSVGNSGAGGNGGDGRVIIIEYC